MYFLATVVIFSSKLSKTLGSELLKDIITVILLSITLTIAKLSELSTISGYSFSQVFTPVGKSFKSPKTFSNKFSE